MRLDWPRRARRGGAGQGGAVRAAERCWAAGFGYAEACSGHASGAWRTGGSSQSTVRGCVLAGATVHGWSQVTLGYAGSD